MSELRVALVAAVLMDVAKGGSLTSYVADQYLHAQEHGLFLSETMARVYFRQFITTGQREPLPCSF